jgi:hypothetical protein
LGGGPTGLYIIITKPRPISLYKFYLFSLVVLDS